MRHEWVKNHGNIPDDVYDRNYFRHFDPDLYDPARKAMLEALRQVVAQCWRAPNITMLPLVEAGQTPAWVGQMPVPKP